jgi:hypothetical protein
MTGCATWSVRGSRGGKLGGQRCCPSPISPLPSTSHPTGTPTYSLTPRLPDSSIERLTVKPRGGAYAALELGRVSSPRGGVRGLVSLDPPPSVRLATTILSYAFALPCIPRIQYLSSVSHLSNHSHALSGLRSSPTLIYPHSIRLNCAPRNSPRPLVRTFCVFLDRPNRNPPVFKAGLPYCLRRR